MFQNDRLLLTCVVLLYPTSGNPDVFRFYTQPSADSTSTRRRIPFEQTFQDGFFSPVSNSCVVVEAPLRHSFAVNSPHFRD
ncbi:MAG: hypothetical protein ACK56F_30545 [bacterium]